MGDIAYQNKDIASKLTGEMLVGKNLAVFGLPHLSVTGILPTNLPAVESNELRIDNLFQLEDGSLAIMDYESKFDRENFIKYLNYIARVLAGILTFSDKVIDEAYKNRIKEEMRMTQIGQMIFADGVVAGKAEGEAIGKEIGEECFAALTERLIEDSRMEDLAKAAKDKAYRADLFREYGIKP